MPLVVEIETDGLDKVEKNINDFISEVRKVSAVAMEEVCRNIAEDIQVRYKGHRIGFKDRTGALRASIQGGFLNQTGDETVGFVGAGDDSIGSDNRATRNYVTYVEYPETRGHGNVLGIKQSNTAFLRPGVQNGIRQMTRRVVDKLSVENVLP